MLAASRQGAVQIRPLGRRDRERLADAYARLGEETRRRRFRSAATRLSERDLDALTAIDHRGHEALAAVTPDGDIIGVARYVGLPQAPGAAEVAVAVADAWHGRGVGRRLLEELAGRARAAGVTRFVAYVGADNAIVRRWLARLGGVAVAHDDDEVVYTVPLDGRALHRPAA
jgi:L-amino acid N-acyltransferase YncA